jgi:cyanate permease
MAWLPGVTEGIGATDEEAACVLVAVKLLKIELALLAPLLKMELALLTPLLMGPLVLVAVKLLKTDEMELMGPP